MNSDCEAMAAGNHDYSEARDCAVVDEDDDDEVSPDSPPLQG